MVTKIIIRDIKGIEELEVVPSKGVTIFEGGNGAGKSSLLEAISSAFALRGKNPDLLRFYSGNAEIIVETDDYTITRKINEKGNTVNVSVGDMKVASPQTWLADKIGNGINFNPIGFFNASDAEQREMLLSTMPISISREEAISRFGEMFSGLDYSRHAIDVVNDIVDLAYRQRKEANAAVKHVENRIEAATNELPPGFCENQAEAIRAQNVEDLYAVISASDNAEKERQNITNSISRLSAQVENLQNKKADLLRQMAAIDNDIEQIQAEIIIAEEQQASIKSIDASAARTALQEYNKSQQTLHIWDNIKNLREELKTKTAEAEWLDNVVKEARGLPAELLSKTKASIDGLTFCDDGVYLNGKKINSLSTGEKMLFAVNVARALNSDIKVICVDGAESLDEVSLETLMKIASGDEYQYFVTKVTKGPLRIVTDGEECSPQLKQLTLEQ